MFIVDGIYIMLVSPVLMSFVMIEIYWNFLGTLDFFIGKLADTHIELLLPTK